MNAEKPNAGLTSGPRLARNVAWNFLGNCAPMLVAIFCIPVLVKRLGLERFGVLTLVWAVIGYATLFDFGLGRALTQSVARKLGTGEHREIPHLVWTSLLLMSLLGFLGTLVVVLVSPWLIHHVLRIPHVLQSETLASFYVLGLSIPVVLGTTGLRGLLEAQQRFGTVNVLRIPIGVFSFIGPLLVLPFSNSLLLIVGVLVAGRVIALLAHFLICLRVTPGIRHRMAWRLDAVSKLLHFGGWMTVSNLIGPLMVTLDRFLIGALVSISAVAYYATPYEVATKFWLIPGAIVAVMFPAFSTSSVQDRTRMAVLFERSVKSLLLGLFPLVLLAIVLAQDGLKLWLGNDFARNSVHVLQWLTVGVFINSLAQVPFALVQGIGKPDLTAKLHLIELPIYLTALYFLTKTLGIEGAAIAWTARVAVDAIFLFGLAKRFLPVGTRFSPRMGLMFVLVLVALGSAILPQGILFKILFLLLTILGFMFFAWFLILSPDERKLAQDFL